MEAQIASKKEEEAGHGGNGAGSGVDGASREASPRTSISSNETNDSNFILQSPSVANTISGAFSPGRHSIDEIRDRQTLSRQTLSRRLSTLSTSSFGDIGDNSLNWNPREAGINGTGSWNCPC